MKELFKILGKRKTNHSFFLILILFISGLFEVFSISLIIPLIDVLGNSNFELYPDYLIKIIDILQIDNYIFSCGIKYYDVRSEIIDHFANILEEKLDENPNLNTYLVLVGEGSIRNEANKHYDKNVRFLGPIIGQTLSVLYARRPQSYPKPKKTGFRKSSKSIMID